LATLAKEVFIVPESKFKGVPGRKDQLIKQAINIFENIRNRVILISEHPEVAKEDPDYMLPADFRLEVLVGSSSHTASSLSGILS
jgi:hypothetical protein